MLTRQAARKAAVLLFALASVTGLIACRGGDSGGGGGYVPPPPPSPVEPRKGVLFGYYGDCAGCLEETRDHVTMVWVAGWGSGERQDVAIVNRAVAAAPLKTVIMLPGMYVNGQYNPHGAVVARGIFAGLRQAGVLANVLMVYPQDEPDVNGLSDEQVRIGNAALREVMAEFPEISDTPLGVIYGGGGNRPGVASYDWVGFDDYNSGYAVLGEAYDDLKRALRPNQRIMLVPGGSSPWRQDPEPFFAKAAADEQVVGVVAFVWFDMNGQDGVGQGIRNNGMAPRYREWALKVK